MPHLLHPYKLVLGTSSGDPSPVINWDFLQSQSLTSFSRTSNATLFDSTGKLTYAANNLVTYSQQFDNSAWNKTTGGASNGTITPDATTAPDGSATADLYTPNTSNIIHAVWQSVTVQVGVKSIYSFYVKANGYNWVSLETYDGGLINTWFDITPGTSGSVGTVGSGCTATITPVGNDWFRCSVTRTPGNASSYFEVYCCNGNNVTAFAANGTSGIYLWGAQVEAVTYQTTPSTYNPTTTAPYYGPRYPYAYNGTTWDAQGLLVEAAGTNLLPYSNDPTQQNGGPVSAGSTPTANYATSPDGTVNAGRVQMTAAGNYLYKRVTTVSAGTYVFSMFLRASSNQNIWVRTAPQTGTAAYVQVAVTSTWQRVSVLATVTGSGYCDVGLDNRSAVVSGDNAAKDIEVWAFQVEAGDQATSYIPNLATGTTTRNADTSLAFSAISLPTGLSFSRASNAMQYDAAGRLTYAPNNLCRQSNSFTTSPWVASNCTPTPGVTDPLGGTSAWTLTATGGPNTAVLYQPIPYGTSVTYVQTFWVRRRTGSGTINWSALAVGVGAAITVTSSWTQVSLAVSNGAGANAYFGIRISTNGDAIDIYAPTFSEVTYETVARPCDQLITTTSAYYGPRYDYDPLTRLPKGLLIEEGRTNVATNSNTFSSWSTDNVPTPSVASGVISPSGNADAWLLTDNSTSGRHIIYGLLGPSGTYTLSLFAKQNTLGYIHLLWSSGVVSYGSTFDLVNGVLGTVNTANSPTSTGRSITPIGNGWFRISITVNSLGNFYYHIGTSNVLTPSSYSFDSPSYVGSGQSVFIYGAQVEAGSFPTSYIPNPGIASGIRSADLPDSTNATVIGCKTFLVETSGMQAATTATILGLNAGIGLGATTGNTLTTAFGGTQTTTATATWTGTVRSGIAWSASKVSITFNGNTVTTAGNATSALTTTSFGHTNNAGTRGAFMNGWIRKAAGYSSALSDASLATKSTVGANF